MSADIDAHNNEIKNEFSDDENADENLTISQYDPHLGTSRWDDKNTGEPYVAVETQEDVEEARKLNKALMEHRYIEVFSANSKEAKEAMRKTGSHSGSYVVKLRGLPYAVTEKQIEEFFSGLEIKPDREGILFVMDRRGRATGEAFVQFETHDDTEQALGRNREKIGHRTPDSRTWVSFEKNNVMKFNDFRYIEIFRSSIAELKRAAPGNGRPVPYDIKDRGSNRGGGGGFNDYNNVGRNNSRDPWNHSNFNMGTSNTLCFNSPTNSTNSGNFVQCKNGGTVYNLTPEDMDFFHMLNEHGLSQYFSTLQAAKIDIGCFETITERDISDLFKDEVGIRIKFRDIVNEWRASNNIAPISSCCCAHASTGTVSGSDSVLSFSGSFSSSAYKFDLNNFLESDIGKKIVANYNSNNQLGEPDREVMITSIVRDHLEKEVPMTIATFEEISGDIVKRFTSETQDFYFQKTKKGGKLSNKYRSMSTTFRKNGFFKKYLRKRKEKHLDETSEEVSESSVVFVDSDEKKWLKTRNSPWDTVEMKWKFTFPLRQREMECQPLQSVLNEWPLLTQSKGYRLIDIDFEVLYPNKTNLFLSNWGSLKEDIVSLCKKLVKFPAAKAIINNLSTNKDLQFIEILKVLQAIFKPVARKIINKKVWKVSTGDAWNSFFVEVNASADIQTVINQRKKFCDDKNINFQPFLIVLKDTSESHMFALVAENLKFLFSDALLAFDIYFKTFFVLHLEYPFENRSFWHFVQEFFYDIPSTNAQRSSEFFLFKQIKVKG